MKEITCNNKKYKSIKAFANEIEISCSGLHKLLNQGYTPEEIADKLYASKFTYNGKNYKSKRQLAKDLGYASTQSKEFVNLTISVAPPKNPCKVSGVCFDSKAAIYNALGMTCSGVRKYAIRHGLSTKEALERLVQERL